MQTIEDRLAFPVAAVGHAVGEPEGARVGAEQTVDLGRLPDVELALLALAVGIEAGGERLLDQHLPLEPADRLGTRAANSGLRVSADASASSAISWALS